MEARFQTTMWSTLLAAREDPARTLDRVVRAYREPVCAYLRRRGLQEADAEDLTQEVFARICDPRFLERADRSKGRFRSLLLAVTHHVLASHWRREKAVKRGGDVSIVALTGVDLFESAQSADPDPEQEEYHRLWAETLTRRALEKLGSHERQKKVVEMFYFGQKSHREIAEALGRSEKDVENDLASARRRMRRWIAEQIEEYASSRDEYEWEMRELSRYL